VPLHPRPTRLLTSRPDRDPVAAANAEVLPALLASLDRPLTRLRDDRSAWGVARTSDVFAPELDRVRRLVGIVGVVGQWSVSEHGTPLVSAPAVVRARTDGTAAERRMRARAPSLH
jgi:hypothetical protein